MVYPLPIDPFIPDILRRLETCDHLILKASPGSGKTTRVPPALLKAKWRKPHQEILVLVPRRLAAKLAAYRVAEEAGQNVGDQIGYQFRFENKTSEGTRLKFITEGLLIRRLLSDPNLAEVAAVVLDEFHERHLHTDIALSYLKHLRQGSRPDLKLIVMSATLATEPLEKFLHPVQLIEIDAKPYPVEAEYLAFGKDLRLEIQVLKAVGEALRRPDHGDLLVFLPGMGEIRRCEERLKEKFPWEVEILPLHGELPREEQEKVFRRYPKTKIILATNIAESSITIEGIRTVIDSGLQRQARFSWWSGIPTLHTRGISQASATQRAGRAGRTAAGRVFKLFSKAEAIARPPFEVPEIQRADLAQTVLELKTLGVENPATWDWFETPSTTALEHACEVLHQLGALASPQPEAAVTATGRRLAALPLHPRLGRIMIEAEAKGVTEAAALLVALLHDNLLEGLDPFHALHQAEHNPIARRTQQQILRSFKKTTAPQPSESTETALIHCLLRGFPDRVARKRPFDARSQATEVELVFCLGGTGKVPRHALIDAHEWFLVLQVQETQGMGPRATAQVKVRSLCPIEPEWLWDLAGGLLTEQEEVQWDEVSQKVTVLNQIRYGQLVLEAHAAPNPEGEKAEAVFLQKIFANGVEKKIQNGDIQGFLTELSHWCDSAPFAETLGRLQLFGKAHPEAEIPSWKSAAGVRLALTALRACTSVKALQARDLSQALIHEMSPALQAQLIRECPVEYSFPHGRKAKIHYSLDREPHLESRLQDFFGVKEGPRILNGTLPVTLHLLAPNGRPVQVTKDLKSFWDSAYPEIRPALSRRYPRHPWPENPLQAKPPNRPTHTKK